MAGSPFDTGQVRSYKLEVDGVELAHFQELSGLTEEYDVVKYEFVDKDGRKGVSLQPGNYKPGEVTLKRGTSDDMKLSDWFDLVAAGQAALARKNLKISMLDGALDKTVASFTLANAWPKKIEYSGVKSSGNEASIETVVIVYEELRRDGAKRNALG
ncbi:MAG TPA: phage tail protein [Acidimicrobiales bacterium]|nr:phage tail protein [Acidimicrobiales bacterium]